MKKMGYTPVLVATKTTLKQKCKSGDCLANAYDNFFYKNVKLKQLNSGVINYLFDYQFIDVKSISDHLPIYLEIE